mgnify:CR=1 FL=1
MNAIEPQIKRSMSLVMQAAHQARQAGISPIIFAAGMEMILMEALLAFREAGALSDKALVEWRQIATHRIFGESNFNGRLI